MRMVRGAVPCPQPSSAVMLKKLKLFTLRSAERLGVNSAVSRSSWRRKRLLILCYHGVSRILPGTAPPELDLEGRFNLTFRQY